MPPSPPAFAVRRSFRSLPCSFYAWGLHHRSKLLGLGSNRPHAAVSLDSRMPYVFINKLLNELRDELLSAMHSAVEREVRAGRPVDVDRLYRAFTRAAAGKMANPVEISERCLATSSSSGKKKSASTPKKEE